MKMYYELSFGDMCKALDDGNIVIEYIIMKMKQMCKCIYYKVQLVSMQQSPVINSQEWTISKVLSSMP